MFGAEPLLGAGILLLLLLTNHCKSCRDIYLYRLAIIYNAGTVYLSNSVVHEVSE